MEQLFVLTSLGERLDHLTFGSHLRIACCFNSTRRLLQFSHQSFHLQRSESTFRPDAFGIVSGKLLGLSTAKMVLELRSLELDFTAEVGLTFVNIKNSPR